uniref:Uncharacterized protein n=1 Tax=Anas platyrhynchos TaxID=8839 RepID=A0A8B9TYX6_ANAPL
FCFLVAPEIPQDNSAMTFTRCDHGMATVKDRIFCIGGRTLKGVSSFVLVTPILFQNGVSVLGCQFSITACESMLYLTGGGSLHDMQKEDSVFMYDIEGQVWKKAGSLPKALVDHASCMIKLSQVNATGEPGRGPQWLKNFTRISLKR